MTATQLLKNLKAVNLQKMTITAVMRDPTEMPEFNREQLMKGLGRDGKPLRPKYSEDPFFKSKAAALRYAKWKQSLNPEAPFDTPDLFINGRTHNSIFLQKSGTGLRMDTNVPWDNSLKRKYRGKHIGLGPEHMAMYRRLLFPRIIKDYNEQVHKS